MTNRQVHGDKGATPSPRPVLSHFVTLLACLADQSESCTWRDPESGAFFDMYPITQNIRKPFFIRMAEPRNAIIVAGVCRAVECPKSGHMLLAELAPDGGDVHAGCIHVPGSDPTSLGMNSSAALSLLQEGVPSRGFSVKYWAGDVCDVTGRPRELRVNYPCDASVTSETFEERSGQAFEGKGNEVCQYTITMPPSQFACPQGLLSPSPPDFSDIDYDLGIPVIGAISGCEESKVFGVATNCREGQRVTLHGYRLQNMIAETVTISVGGAECTDLHFENDYECSCALPELPASSVDSGYSAVDVLVTFQMHTKKEDRDEEAHDEDDDDDGWDLISLPLAVTYRPSTSRRRLTADAFRELGVGGLAEELTSLYRRVFQSRTLPEEVRAGLGIDHVKGVLLYGPPGCGKTLMGRSLARLIGAESVAMINTPELMSKYLGESEKNLMAHFAVAERDWDEHKDESRVHVIIFDEIDAIFRERSKGDGSSARMAYDSLVNLLLTKMDGLTKRPNVVIIGLTNRKELLDPALLRPGRFEVQIEIGLPDESGRREIFGIHTREMKAHGFLSPDVNLDVLARESPRLSGAEIAGVVRNAVSIAVSRGTNAAALAMDKSDNDKEPSDKHMKKDPTASEFMVIMQDFREGIAQLEPVNGLDLKSLKAEYMPFGYLPVHRDLLAACQERIEEVRSCVVSTSPQPAFTILLHGPSGTGKTGLAMQFVLKSNFDFVKVISPWKMVTQSEQWRIEHLQEAFETATKAESALILLDDLEGLVESITMNSQSQFSPRILRALLTLLTFTTSTAHSSQMVVIATSRGGEGTPVHESLSELFHLRLYVPEISTDHATEVVRIFNLSNIEGGDLHIPESPRSGIALRPLLMAIQTCRRREANCTKEGQIFVSQPDFNAALSYHTGHSLEPKNMSQEEVKPHPFMMESDEDPFEQMRM